MKIFDWVQRRVHYRSLKDELARNVKTAESITNEAGKQALLKQVAVIDVLDGWRDGILSIGTLGLDQFKSFNQQNEYFVLESEEEDGIQDEEEHERYSVSNDDDDDDNNNANEEENPLLFSKFEQNFDVNSVRTNEIEENPCFHDNDHERKRKKGERTTLAELFLADSEMKKKQDSEENEFKPVKKPPVYGKKSPSFVKKFIPHVGEGSSPVKKLNQLMTRMLRRKIHPEFERKDDQTDDQKKTSMMEFITSRRTYDAAESVSLLPTLPGLTAGSVPMMT